MFCVCAGKAIVHIGAHVLPVGISQNLFLVLLDLQVDGNSLIDIVGGDAAIGCYAQDLFLLWRIRHGGDLSHVPAVHRVRLFDQSVL